jgi:hypothetical protein
MATASLITDSTQISQGAEAVGDLPLCARREPLNKPPQKVYKAYIHANLDSDARVPILLKYRFKKQYRHPSLDANLTRARVAGEARALLRCLRSGVSVPGIRMVDAIEGALGIEWIEGKNVRMLLGGGAEGEEGKVLDPDEFFDDTNDTSGESLSHSDPLEEYQVTMGMFLTSTPALPFQPVSRRRNHGIDWVGNRKDAQSRHHPRRSHNFQHDHQTPIRHKGSVVHKTGMQFAHASMFSPVNGALGTD